MMAMRKWVWDEKLLEAIPAYSGGISLPEKVLIIFETVPLQERDELVLETYTLMMLGLASEIGSNGLSMRMAYGEGAITRLPREAGESLRKGLVNPARRACFDGSQGLGNRGLFVQ